MDRISLESWGLDLPDAEFCRALAALGVVAAMQPERLQKARTEDAWKTDGLLDCFRSAIKETAGLLPWKLPLMDRQAQMPRILVKGVSGRQGFALSPAPSALDMASVWNAFMADLPPGVRATAPYRPRLAVQSRPGVFSSLLNALELLTKPEVGAEGVFMADAFPSDGRLDWNWPFTISTLPGDALERPFAELGTHLPPGWPYRFHTASRDASQAEVLVIGTGLQDALVRVLTSGLPLRCRMVVVAGLGSDPPAKAEATLGALVSHLSAEGVAVLDSVTSPEEFTSRLQEFADSLCHSRPLDVALMDSFGNGVRLIANNDLLLVSHLDTAIARTADRLRDLGAKADIALSERTIDRLRIPRDRVRARIVLPTAPSAELPPTAGASPDDIATAIKSARTEYRYDRESGEAAAFSELNGRIAERSREAASSERIQRFLMQQSFVKRGEDFVETKSGYIIGKPVMVEIYIGQKYADSIAAPEAFPEHRLPPSRDGHRLQVVLHEPRQFDGPMLREIHLPTAGDSSKASFTFTPRLDGAFEARVSVLHRGRVLQTVLLQTTVHAQDQESDAVREAIALVPETQVRHDWSDLDTRRRFDLAMILNHTTSEQPLLTGVQGARAWATDLSGIEEPVRDLNELISKVAHSVADYEDGLDQGENPELLVKLARIGADLYSVLYKDQLGVMATEGLSIGDAKVEYLQVISARADAIVPLEFMYDFNAPQADAEVCPQHQNALRQGHCAADCPRASKPRGYVCPMGFWGLKKVIERHLYDPRANLPDRAQVVVDTQMAEAAAGRDRLEIGAGAVVGYSQEVQPAQVSDLVSKLGKKLGKEVPVVKDWDEWMNAVQKNAPALLVAFPHNEGSKRDVRLEIGGKMLSTLDLPATYVRAPDGPAPLVFLLGCDVAGTAQEFSNHIRYFRQAGAAVVISTIATVFGAHAVRVGDSIVEQLIESKARGNMRIGEAIRDAKRSSLLASLPMALCVVAFGDADWRV